MAGRTSLESSRARKYTNAATASIVFLDEGKKARSKRASASYACGVATDTHATSFYGRLRGHLRSSLRRVRPPSGIVSYMSVAIPA